MINYENAHSYLDAFSEAIKDDSFTGAEKEAMREILKSDQIGELFGSGRVFRTNKYTFLVHESTLGYNLGVVE